MQRRPRPVRNGTPSCRHGPAGTKQARVRDVLALRGTLLRTNARSSDAVSDSRLRGIWTRLHIRGQSPRAPSSPAARRARSSQPTVRSRLRGAPKHPGRRVRTFELSQKPRLSRVPHVLAPVTACYRTRRAIAFAQARRPPSSRRPPCPPYRSPCRDARSPRRRPSGAKPDRPPCPTIRSRDRLDRLA